MKNRSIISKLILVLALTIVCGAFVTNYIVSRRLKNVLEKELYEEAFIILQSLDWAMRPLLETESEEEVQRLIDNIAAYPIVDSLRLYDKDETVVFSNHFSEENSVIHNGCVNEVISNNALRKSYEDIDKGIFEAALPVKGSQYDAQSGSDIQGVLYLKIDMDYVLNLWNQLIDDFQIVYYLMSVILIVLAGLYIYISVGKPLKQFKTASEAITEKNYNYEVTEPMSGEFIELKEAYDEMRTSIRTYIEEVDDAKKVAEEASMAKMTFITNMSHEIRSPLNSIIGFTDILADQEHDDAKKKQLEIIHNSGHHLLDVINDLLDFSKIDSNQMTVELIDFEIRKLVLEISDLFIVQVSEKGLDYSTNIGNEVPLYIRSDMSKIRQILINLINNAIKFTEKGSVAVEVGFTDPYLTIEVRDTGIGVEENKFEAIFDAFAQSDESTARKYGGTGLGLSISKRFSQLLGGDIELISETGKGSVFKVNIKVEAVVEKTVDGRGLLCKWIHADSELMDLVYDTVLTLPERLSVLKQAIADRNTQEVAEHVHALKGLTGNFQMNELYVIFEMFNDMMKDNKQEGSAFWEQCAAYMNEATAIMKPVHNAAVNHCNMDKIMGIKKAHSSHKRILVVEDMEPNRLLIGKMLEPFDIDVIYAEDGQKAIDILKKEEIDIMLLDIQMPNLSGEDVLRIMHDNDRPDGIGCIPYTIVLTAHATKAEREKCLALGADDYLTKPIQKDLLRAKIRQQL